MSRKVSQVAIVIVLGLVSLGRAFFIDPNSCTGDVASMVTDASNSAFQLADAGLKAIQDIEGGTASDQIKTLAEKIFTTDQSNLANVKAYFSNLVNNAVRNPSQTKDTIRIYCNANHLEKKANSEDTLDKDNFADLVKEALTACDIEIPNPTDANGPKGFVIAWTGVVDDVPDDQKFSTVVICPKTIQKFQAMAKGAANIPVTLPPWTKDPNLLKDAGFLATANKISVMDMLALLDVIMLHEFTHTLIAAANQEEGRSEDIGGNSLAGNTDSYGWTNVLRLARDDPDRCDFNADSLAYFALGVAIVNVGGIPNDDGSITVSNPPPTQALAALQVGVVNNAASSGGSGGQNQSQAGNHSAIAARHLFGYKQRAWIG